MGDKNAANPKAIPRLVHAISLLAVLIVAVALCFSYPDIYKNSSTSLSSAGTFITIWGVAIAIVEIIRLQSSAEIAKLAAQRVYDQIGRIDMASQVSQCESLIKAAMECVDERRHIPNAVIAQIISLYSRLFLIELKESSSEHRENRSILVAYTLPMPKHANAPYRPPKSTTKALFSILSQLGDLTGSATSFEKLTS